MYFRTASECRQSLHSGQTERNAGGFDVFFLVGVVAYGRGKNTSESNDGGHFARRLLLNCERNPHFDFCIFFSGKVVSLLFRQVCLQSERYARIPLCVMQTEKGETLFLFCGLGHRNIIHSIFVYLIKRTAKSE